MEKLFILLWHYRHSLRLVICWALNYFNILNKTPMENLTLKISTTTTSTVIIPRYFLRSNGDYYKLIDKKTYINVVYYGEDVLQYSLYLYPKIVIHTTEILNGLDVISLKQITEDEFYTAYYEAKNLIEKLAGI